MKRSRKKYRNQEHVVLRVAQKAWQQNLKWTKFAMTHFNGNIKRTMSLTLYDLCKMGIEIRIPRL